MGLDKWLKPEEEKKLKKKEKNDLTSQKIDEKISKKLFKFELICSNKKCKYQKIIIKKVLTEKDKNCPRCSSLMKGKKI
ncbi:MAG: hypothetical protein ACFE9T_03605 [Promethearchaeota archaeon]